MADKHNFSDEQRSSKIKAIDKEVCGKEILDENTVLDDELDERNLGCMAVAKLHFNRNRKIIIKNVPPVTYEVCIKSNRPGLV